MNEFKQFHPLVNFIFFAAVIFLSVLLMHPVCRVLSFLAAFLYYAVLSGGKQAAKRLLWMIPMILFMALLNPAFNHAGITILTYLPSGNPLTLESILYGVFAALMISGVILWFSSFHEIMTTDKFVYLFGRLLPALSLLLSMTLRFVPKFTAQFRVVKNAQEGLGRSLRQGSHLSRIKCAAHILSVMLTWALETSIITADSMRARGYGLPGRTSFSLYTFEKRDRYALGALVIGFIYVAIGIFSGELSYTFFPYRTQMSFSIYSVSLYLVYFILCLFPVIIELWEVILWRSSKSEI